MANAKKLPSGNWRVNLYIGKDDNGKRKYKSFTAETKKEAEFLAATYNLKRKEKPKDITVGDAIDGYIQSKENVLSPSTIGGYKNIRKNRLQGIMDIPLNRLNNIIIQKEINAESARLSPKSIRDAHGLLSAAVSMYMPDFTIRTTLPAKEHKIKDLPTPEQIIEIVTGTDIEIPVMLALWLGLRMSEIRGLRFTDISEDGIITIQNTIITVNNKFIEKSQTKTYNSTRQIKAPNYIITLIQNANHKSEHIVTLSGQAIYKRFKRLIAKYDLKDMTFHDLRHLNASIMLALGIPDKYAMERGGWSTNVTLKNIYQHTFSEERKIIDNKIDNYFSELILKDK
ncbi:MAG: site-specific integrase [Ruminococcus sp.]|nr:site-specific integrase [Ruminococcus sp.]